MHVQTDETCRGTKPTVSERINDRLESAMDVLTDRTEMCVLSAMYPFAFGTYRA